MIVFFVHCHAGFLGCASDFPHDIYASHPSSKIEIGTRETVGPFQKASFENGCLEELQSIKEVPWRCTFYAPGGFWECIEKK